MAPWPKFRRSASPLCTRPENLPASHSPIQSKIGSPRAKGRKYGEIPKGCRLRSFDEATCRNGRFRRRANEGEGCGVLSRDALLRAAEPLRGNWHENCIFPGGGILIAKDSPCPDRPEDRHILKFLNLSEKTALAAVECRRKDGFAAPLPQALSPRFRNSARPKPRLDVSVASCQGMRRPSAAGLESGVPSDEVFGRRRRETSRISFVE